MKKKKKKKKKNKIMLFAATWMGLDIFILSEVRERKTNVICYHFYVKSKKKWYKLTYSQNRNRVTDIETNLWVTLEEKGGKLGDSDWYIHSSIYKINSKNYCIEQGTLLNTLKSIIWENNLKKSEYIYIYICITIHFAIHQKLTEHCKSIVNQL